MSNLLHRSTHRPVRPLRTAVLLYCPQVDHDINDLKSNVEKSKNDTIKTVITILGTFSAIAFTVSRLMGTST